MSAVVWGQHSMYDVYTLRNHTESVVVVVVVTSCSPPLPLGLLLVALDRGYISNYDRGTRRSAATTVFVLLLPPTHHRPIYIYIYICRRRCSTFAVPIPTALCGALSCCILGEKIREGSKNKILYFYTVNFLRLFSFKRPFNHY